MFSFSILFLFSNASIEIFRPKFRTKEKYPNRFPESPNSSLMMPNLRFGTKASPKHTHSDKYKEIQSQQFLKLQSEQFHQYKIKSKFLISNWIVFFSIKIENWIKTNLKKSKRRKAAVTKIGTKSNFRFGFKFRFYHFCLGFTNKNWINFVIENKKKQSEKGCTPTYFSVDDTVLKSNQWKWKITKMKSRITLETILSRAWLK